MKKILIVEDSKVVVEKLKEDLINIGYELLLIVASGKEAIEMTQNDIIDLIIMDITLEGKMDGIEASKNINKEQNIPTIYLTEDIKSHKGLPGAYAYLNKPFTRNELKYNIEIVLKQQALKKDLQAEIQWFSGLFKYSTEGIIMFDANFLITDINQTYKNIFDYEYEALINEPLRDLISSHISFQMLKKKFLSKKSLELEKELIFNTGHSKHFFIRGIPIFNEKNYIGGYLMYIDITELKRKEKEIRYISEHDAMTGLYNRRFFQKKLDELSQNKNLNMSLIMGDINNLKRINDTYGHSIGDKYIKLMAKVLLASLPSDSIVARIGGDEFGIILINENEEMCLNYCDLINQKANEYTINKNLKEALMISLGYSVQKKNRDNSELLFRQADQMMYENKREMKSY